MLVPAGEVMVCRSCGKKHEKKRDVVITKIDDKKKEIPVVDMAKLKGKISTIEEPCPKCRAKEAMWEMRQTRGVDEPATRFFKCMKCGHTWREYS